MHALIDSSVNNWRTRQYDNYQRIITLHGSANVTLEHNVGHRTFGHAFYLEDGIETGNLVHHNLVAA